MTQQLVGDMKDSSSWFGGLFSSKPSVAELNDEQKRELIEKHVFSFAQGETDSSDKLQKLFELRHILDKSATIQSKLKQMQHFKLYDPITESENCEF